VYAVRHGTTVVYAVCRWPKRRYAAHIYVYRQSKTYTISPYVISRNLKKK